MRHIGLTLPPLFRFVVESLLLGGVLYLFGLWCLWSTDIPSPPLALPLPGRVLDGWSFLFLIPHSLVAFTLFLAVSRLLVCRVTPRGVVAILLTGLAAMLVGALWVPNPVTLWPFSILGDHTLPELIHELFPFHIIPAPEGDLGSASGDSLGSWQTAEMLARLGILVAVWAGCLAVVWRVFKRHEATNNPLGSIGNPQTT